MVHRKFLLLAGLAACLFVASGAAAQTRVAIPKATATIPAGATILGAATDQVDVLVGLHHRDQAGLDAFVKAVSDPNSKQYQRFLTAAQFRARYAASDSDVSAVRAFATANGLNASVPRNRTFVELTGSAANAAKAFATTLTAVKVDGRVAHVPTAAVTVPANLAKIVTSVEGLDTSRLIHPDATTFPNAYVNAGPCSTYWGEKTADDVPGALGQDHLPYVPCGYTPAQLRSAYGVDKVVAAGVTGKGVNVGIIDAFDYPHAEADANTYADKRGEIHLPSYTDHSPPGLDSTPEAPGALLLDPNGWAGEQQLDVEAVHAMAPGAAIHYYGASTPVNAAFTVTQNQVVDAAAVQIVSNSYGGASDSADANTEAILQQAAATGIGFYFSSGDQGDETKNPDGDGSRSVDSSANQPLATGVGGTSLAVGQDGGYEFETGWGTYSATLTNGAFGDTAFNSGGGGGTSEVYKQPDYQAGIVPASIGNYFGDHADQSVSGAPLLPGRAVPDVAMDADPQTGMLVGQQQDFDAATNGVSLPTDSVKYSEYRIGGTSLASPLFAGVMALADQAAGKAHGFANPALYKLAGSGAFHDVVDPAQKLGVIRKNYTNSLDASGGVDTLLRTLNDTNTIHTIAGYDDVTGLGSPQGVALLHALAPGNAAITELAMPPGTGSTPTPGSCTRHRITIKLGGKAKTAVIKLGGHKTRRLHGVRTFTIKTTAKLRHLVTRVTFAHKRFKVVRHVNTCGLKGKPKVTRLRH